MRAFVVTGPGRGEVHDVAPPAPTSGQVVIDIARVGVCGTDVEFFTGEMAYLDQGFAAYPLRLGHEWCGTVTDIGDGVDPGWLGRRVTGDTMLGCGRCRRCAAGRGHVCADRFEVGIRGGFPGALADRLAMPVTALVELPDTVDDVAGAMVEPAGNAWRCVDAAGVSGGDRLLVIGPGTIGLLVAGFAAAVGAEVHIAGIDQPSLEFARSLGHTHVGPTAELEPAAYDAVVDATSHPAVPSRALDLVEPGGRVVYIGLAGVPSTLDTRDLVLKDVTAVGILGASAGLAGAVHAFATGAVDPRPLVAATVGLAETAAILGGTRPDGATAAPKVHVDPRLD